MFGLAIISAALALAGAPSTPIRCNPTLPPDLQGVTRWADTTQPASLIELNVPACAGLLFLSATPRELHAIEKLNPSVNVSEYEGVGVQVLLMEVAHTTHPYGGVDETDDLCRANALLPTLLGRYLAGSALASALDWAAQYTASQNPAVYHTHPC